MILFQSAVDRWEEIIVGDLPDATYSGIAVDDLLIHVASAPIDGAGGVLGSGGPDALRSGTFLPYHGSITIDSDDAQWLESNGSLRDTFLHEIGHVLGFGTLWSLKDLIFETQFLGPQAQAEYFALGGLGFVPVEDGGGPGTALSHWEESVFGSELMTGFLNGGVANPISRVTIASMADLGYSVNLDAADPFVLG